MRESQFQSNIQAGYAKNFKAKQLNGRSGVMACIRQPVARIVERGPNRFIDLGVEICMVIGGGNIFSRAARVCPGESERTNRLIYMEC